MWAELRRTGRIRVCRGVPVRGRRSAPAIPLATRSGIARPVCRVSAGFRSWEAGNRRRPGRRSCGGRSADVMPGRNRAGWRRLYPDSNAGPVAGLPERVALLRHRRPSPAYLVLARRWQPRWRSRLRCSRRRSFGRIWSPDARRTVTFAARGRDVTDASNRIWSGVHDRYVPGTTPGEVSLRQLAGPRRGRGEDPLETLGRIPASPPAPDLLHLAIEPPMARAPVRIRVTGGGPLLRVHVCHSPRRRAGVAGPVARRLESN